MGFEARHVTRKQETNNDDKIALGFLKVKGFNNNRTKSLKKPKDRNTSLAKYCHFWLMPFDNNFFFGNIF